MTTADPLPTIRLDLWLWAARFYKTRAIAKEAVEGHRVEVAGQHAKPSRAVRAGEHLTIRRGDDVFQVEVLGVDDRRGPAAVAQALYRESDESREARLKAAAERRAAATGYQPPKSKPDKRARRLIQALGDLDMI